MPGMETPLLELRAVEKRFVTSQGEELRALASINLSVQANDLSVLWDERLRQINAFAHDCRAGIVPERLYYVSGAIANSAAQRNRHGLSRVFAFAVAHGGR